jgi:hypothetical protein
VAALREALSDYLAFAGARRLIWGSGLGGWARRVGHPRPRRIETRQSGMARSAVSLEGQHASTYRS